MICHLHSRHQAIRNSIRIRQYWPFCLNNLFVKMPFVSSAARKRRENTGVSLKSIWCFQIWKHSLLQCSLTIITSSLCMHDGEKSTLATPEIKSVLSIIEPHCKLFIFICKAKNSNESFFSPELIRACFCLRHLAGALSEGVRKK